jgi:DNA-directed RNA polymerase specialized sigma24 family protein
MDASRSTAELIAAIRAGNSQAETAVFQKYVVRLIALARSRLSRKLASRVDPEDVVFSAWRSFFIGVRSGRFPQTGDADLWPLLVTITLRKLSRQVRSQTAERRDIGRERPLDSSSLADLNDQTAPEAAAILADEVESLSSRLGEFDRQVLVRTLNGADAASIAAELGCSDRTVRRSRAAIDDILRSNTEPVDATPITSLLRAPPRTAPRKSNNPPSDSAPTHGIDDLTLHEFRGEGGFCRVYRATERSSGQIVAVKFLKKTRWTDPNAIASVIREHEVLTRLSHPGIIASRGWGRTPAGPVFLVLDWWDAPTLQTYCGQAAHSQDFPRILARIAETLAAAHSQGVLHCDLKPPNILMPAPDQPILMDFGMARRIGDADDSIPGGGSAGFLAPEIVSDAFGPISERTDIYGWGAIGFALYTGHPPIQGPDLPGILDRLLSPDEADLTSLANTDCPPVLKELISNCLAKRPNQRPTRAGEITKALAAD